ncbi:MAG: alpha-ketoglutarate-dependent dioxygenase AlkB [Saprospiraceae bacterium]
MMGTSLNCEIKYIENFLPAEVADTLYRELIDQYQIESLKVQLNPLDKSILSDYSKLMFMDQDLYATNKFPEEHWGKTAVWSPQLLSIRKRVEEITNKIFKICVCIYYPDGNSGVDFHSDYLAFGDTNLIPSLSIGAERAFLLREKSTQKLHQFHLAKGSLFIMGKDCQQNYEHSLPINPEYKKGRINLTFRPYGFD